MTTTEPRATEPRATEPRTTEPRTTDTVIAEARARIDALDARLIDLIKERMAASAEVQAARIAAGGPRLSLARENRILERWREELGRPGTDVAMSLLELCRGRI